MAVEVFQEGVGRDEMNLCDLPFFILDNRTRGKPEARYSREVKRGNETIRLELTVKGDPLLGLPSTREEDLTLALLDVAKRYNNFSGQKVQFIQADLLRELDWGTRGEDYKRLERAFATLNAARYCVNGWRDNARRKYTAKGAFQVVGDYMLRDARAKKKARGCVTLPSVESEPFSYFHWGQVLFESFQSGYIKQLDRRLIKQFTKAATTRLYRYLDKLFNPPKYVRVEERLRELAFEQLAIPRTCDLSGIRRRLEPAIDELVACGFLTATPWAKRIQKKVNGDRIIVFEKKPEGAFLVQHGHHPETEQAGLEKYLISLGIESGTGPTGARTLVETFDHGLLRENAERYEALAKAGENVTPGLIVSTTRTGNKIRLDGIKTERMIRAERAETKKAVALQLACDAKTEQNEDHARLESLRQQQSVDDVLATLKDNERQQIELEAYENATAADQAFFEKCKAFGLVEGRYRILYKHLMK